MITKVFDYVQKYHMIEKDDTIAAGISGGADSVCLLFMLLEIREKIPFRLGVVHVNHGIRPDAGEDAAFVRKLCEQKGLPFYLEEVHVSKEARRLGISEEEAGRQCRYGAFEKALQDLQADSPSGGRGRIAVAHNSNDRAETMLFHLFRGTGLTGLAGIKPVNGAIIRPLLCLERREIEEWLKERKLPWCTDSTNALDVYTRNKIRHHILPFAEEHICKGAVAHMNRTAGELEEAECFIQKAVQEAGSRCTAGHGTGESRQICINIPAFLQEDRYLQGRILLSCLEDMTDTRKDITAVHIGNILKFLEGTGSGEIHLPYGLMACRNYDMAVIKRRQEEEERVSEKEKIFLPKEEQLPCSIPVPGLGNVEISLFSYEKSQEIPQKTYTKWFDYDKITKYAVFRVREKGDFLTINSKMDKKSLQDYFINEKIPKGGRDTLYVLADGPHILWVPGYRISEYYKVSEKTRRVLQVHVEKEKGVETWLRK